MNDRKLSLSSALAAYAGATSGEHLDARLVRARILRTTQAPRRRSLRRFSFVLPLAAAFVASAAMAASHPGVRSVVVMRFEALLGTAPALPRPAPASARNRVVPFVAGSRAPVPVSSAGLDPDSSTPIAVDDLPLAPPTASVSDKSPNLPAIPSSAAQIDPQLAAYRAAHRTHFDSGDAKAALSAWDSYLSEFPDGSFVDDARFNRALCLIRLGQLAAARAALSAFANAPAGSYRQVEAESLLSGLDAHRGSSQK
jgi:hypothetical protein